MSILSDIQTKNIKPINTESNIGSVNTGYKNGYFSGNLVSSNMTGYVLQYGGRSTLQSASNLYYLVNGNPQTACYISTGVNLGRERTGAVCPFDGILNIISYYKQRNQATGFSIIKEGASNVNIGFLTNGRSGVKSVNTPVNKGDILRIRQDSNISGHLRESGRCNLCLYIAPSDNISTFSALYNISELQDEED